MHAGIPQITINFPEYSFINNQIEVASLIPLDVSVIISSANKLLYDVTYYNKLSENAKIARLQYNWQQESEKLVKFYNNII